ncbi:MAG: type III polyketide synthase [Thermoguttaceae bacterium]
MSMTILGLATAEPAQSIEQSEAARIARTFLSDGREARLLPALFQRTQVRSRGSVLLESGNGCGPRQSFYPPSTGPSDRGPATALRMQRYAEESLPLAAAAAARSLALAATGPEAITHLITVSCTGFFAPGLDIGLVKRLELPPTVGRLHVGFMGCHGVLNAMQAARATVLADPASVVLLCAVELCSLHYQYGAESDALVANALFADGAAALVGRASADGEEPWRLVATGSYLLPDAEDGMTWKIGNHGFEMTLSSRVPELIGGHLGPWLEGWLTRSGRRLEEIRSWAIHPGGPRILTSVAAALRLPQTAIATSAEVLARCGNMSSPTILFVLKRLQEQGGRPPCVVLGFGPGLVAEAALLE